MMRKWLVAGWLFGALSALDARAATWDFFVHPDLLNRVPDFLAGDLLVDPTDMVLPGQNVFGAGSYSGSFGSLAGNTYQVFTGTLDIDLSSYTRSGSVTTYSSFDIDLDSFEGISAQPGQWQSSSGTITYDLASHAANANLDVVQTFASGTLTSADVPYAGWLLVHGLNPATAISDASVASYLSSVVIPRLPDDWTGIFLNRSPGTYQMTAQNTGGTLAPFFVGGQVGYLTVGWTNDPLYIPSLDEAAVAAGGGAQQLALLGGASVPGGVDVTLASPGGGRLSLDLLAVTAEDLTAGADGIPAADFALAINGLQYVWELSFDGDLFGPVQIDFGFDFSGLDPGVAPEDLVVYHFEDTNADGTADAWVSLETAIDVLAGTVSVQADGFSPFALGLVVPEPSTALLVLGLLLPVALARRARGDA